MRTAFRSGNFFPRAFMRAARLTYTAVSFAFQLAARTSRFNLRPRGRQRGMVGAVDDSGRARLAAMGRMDSAVLSVRCTRSAEKSLVLMWLPVGGGRNA